MAGIIVEHLGPLSYLVETETHQDQLKEVTPDWERQLHNLHDLQHAHITCITIQKSVLLNYYKLSA